MACLTQGQYYDLLNRLKKMRTLCLWELADLVSGFVLEAKGTNLAKQAFH